MAYVCHCDICDAKIASHEHHRWYIGEEEKTNASLYPPSMDICESCFPMFQKEIHAFIEKIRRWKGQR